MPGFTLDIPMTGWNGQLTLGGLRIPNWLVILAAAFFSVLAASVAAWVIFADE